MTTSVGLDRASGADGDPADRVPHLPATSLGPQRHPLEVVSDAVATVVTPTAIDGGPDGGSWQLLLVPILICVGLVLYVFLV